jgi:hypothetical protein
MYKLQPNTSKKSKPFPGSPLGAARAGRNNWIAYTVTLMIAVVALSLLTYVGPPFGPSWQEILQWISDILPSLP